MPARRLIPIAVPMMLALYACRTRGAGVSPTVGAAGAPPVASLCARVASCAHPHEAAHWRNPSACVDFWLMGPPDAELRSCLSSALTCDAVRACLHPSRLAAGAAFCRAHPGVQTGCEGTALVSCSADDPDESTLLDCATFGAKCGDLVQAGGLTTHACIDPARCPAGLTKAWCSGPGDILSCRDGEVEHTPCAAGATCHEHTDEDGERLAMCEGPGHIECAAPGKKRCDGSTLVECETHGHFAHGRAIDCAAAGLACALTDAGAACDNPHPECQAGHPKCEGNALAFCASGLRVKVDCGEIGLGPCEADGRGPDATCRPTSGEGR